jgi:hypothetical protein
LELDLVKDVRGKIPLFVQAGAFRTAPGRQLAEVVVEFPWDQLKHYWETNTGKLEASVGVLGVVHSRRGKLITRFSDLLWPSYWPTILEGAATLHALKIPEPYSKWDQVWLPTRYETQFDLPPGEYELRVVLDDGKKLGRAAVPLVVEKYDANSLGLGSILLCKRFRDAHVAAVETAAANFAPQYVPLVSKGIRVTPAGDTHFRPGEPLIPYFEIYAPQGASEPTVGIQAHLRIVDAKSGALVKDFPAVDATEYAQPGSTTIPIAREVPIAALPKGEYRLEVQASDSAGHSTPWQTANFTIVGKE